jgi:hypothetical protein
MGQRGNPFMVKGNKLATGPHKPKKALLKAELESLTPRVLEIIRKRLYSDDATDQYLMMKELLPYCFPKKAPVVTAPTASGESLELKDYLQKRIRYGLDQEHSAL